MSELQRIHVIYTGSVQGVGFRFTAERVAEQLGITGFVRNLPDGNVETICEGTKAQLTSFIKKINDDMQAYISDFNVDWEPARGEFTSFGIRF